MTKKQLLNLGAAIFSLIVTIFFIAFTVNFLDIGIKSAAKITSTPDSAPGFTGGTIIEYVDIEFIDQTGKINDVTLNNFFRDELLGTNQQIDIAYSQTNPSLVFLDNWVDVFGFGFIIAFFTIVVVVLVLSMFFVFKSESLGPLQGLFNLSFAIILILSIFTVPPRVKHLIGQYNLIMEEESFTHLPINEYLLKIPSSWSVTETDFGYDFDVDGTKIASINCPMPESGFEAWNFETKSKLTKTHGFDLWVGTPKPETDVDPLTLIFMHRNDFDNWYVAGDYQYSCYLSSSNLDSSISEMIYNSIKVVN